MKITSPFNMNIKYFFATSMLFLISSAYSQCTKDTECKGDRICEKGLCIAPNASPPRLDAVVPKNPSQSLAIAVNPRFEDYPSQKYSGQIVYPKGVRRVNANEWRNEMGKLVEPPSANFAGKFNISVNSCGTGCRYFTMTDLSIGKSTNTLSIFASDEPPPKTREGYTYITELIGRVNSHMLVAQYLVDNPKGQECRERIFIFENEMLKPITNTKSGCTVF